jgi:hypothetical protein
MQGDSVFIVWQIIHLELPPQVPEPLRIHRPTIIEELPQAFQPGPGEECRRAAHRVGTDLEQPAIKHPSHGFRDLRLAPLRPAAPRAQEQSVRQLRLLAETWHQLEADEISLGRAERMGCRFPGHARA